jgi:hypothetical protein
MAQSLLCYVVFAGGVGQNQAISKKINQGGVSMHSLVFVLSIIGFGLEVAAFLMTIAVL